MMKGLSLLLVHFVTVIARSLGPGGISGLMAQDQL